jgi:hypothetical protein
MKKVNEDPFSNGTEHMMFEAENCDKCIKNSVYDEKNDRYTNADEDNMPNRCSILRDIMYRMVTGNPINQRTIDVCHDFLHKGILCPYMKTEWPKKKAEKQPKEQMKLEL